VKASEFPVCTCCPNESRSVRVLKWDWTSKISVHPSNLQND
jgi:hypothetical protein